LEETGTKAALERMIRIEQELTFMHSVSSGWAECGDSEAWRQEVQRATDIKALVRRILEFERHILAERLNNDFLARRAQWVVDLHHVRNFASLQGLINELCDGIRERTTVPAMTQAFRQLLGRRDLAPGLLDLVVGHKRLRALAQAALLTTTTGDRRDRWEERGAPPPDEVNPVAENEGWIPIIYNSTVGSFRRWRQTRRERLRAQRLTRDDGFSSARGLIKIQAHCWHAQVAIEDVLSYFCVEDKKAVPTEGPSATSPANRPSSFALNFVNVPLSWSLLVGNSTPARVFDATGAAVTHEPTEVLRAGREPATSRGQVMRTDVRPEGEVAL
jgi:hypothetical protein